MDFLGIACEAYASFERGEQLPDIDIVTKLSNFYGVTVDEFYGFSPRIFLHSPDGDEFAEDAVDENTLKLSDLSWEEAQLIYYYRNYEGDKEEIIKKIIEANF